jgi:hypothetical protein
MPDVETLIAPCVSESGTACVLPATTDTMINITSFTGGLATSLDSLLTPNRRLNSLVRIQPGGPGFQLITVQLLETTAAAETGVRIRPLDYNASTNPRQWEVVAD